MKAEIKPGFGQDRVMLKDAIPLDTPFTLNIVPSTVCNFKCVYCVHSLDKKEFDSINFKPELMDWDIFMKSVEQMKQFPGAIKSVFLYGNGEPLCHKRLADMVSVVKEASPTTKVGFITNGFLFDEKNMLELIEAGIDNIRISIQGVTAEKYSSVCGVSLDFKEYLNKLKFLYKNKKQCQIFIKTLDIALAEGEDKIFFEMFGNLCDRIFIEKAMPVFAAVDYSSMLGEKDLTDRYGQAHKHRLVCPQVFYTLTVWPNGDVYPCDVLSDPLGLGNINDTNLLEIWNGKTLKEFQLMQLEKKRYDNSICENCCAPDDVAQPSDDLENYFETANKEDFPWKK